MVDQKVEQWGIWHSAHFLNTRTGSEREKLMGTILVIDDDPAIRNLLRTGYETLGYDVQEAPDGKTGIKLFQENPADLVVTDILLPEKDGLEIIRWLQHEHPRVKIIAISGKGSGGNLDFLPEAQMFGAIYTLAKPFSWSSLAYLTQQAIGPPPVSQGPPE